VAGLVYLLLRDGFGNGQGLGKQMMKIVVVRNGRNAPIRFHESILRNALLVALLAIPYETTYQLAAPLLEPLAFLFAIAPYAIEPVTLLATGERWRFGDRLAGTKVVQVARLYS
jgi:uncharacterized RDD family membrane protein YckC